MAADGKTWTTWTGTTTLEDIAPNSSKILLLKGVIDKNATGDVTNTVTVTSRTNDPNLNNNTSTTIGKIHEDSNLVTTVTVDKDTVTPGDSITYNINIKNNGPAVAITPSVSVNPPLENIEYSTDGGKTWTPWTGTITLTDIPDGASSNILIRGKVPSTSVSDIITNFIVTPKNNNPLKNSNNTVTTKTPIELNSDIRILATIDNCNIQKCCMITYTVIIKNDGPAIAKNPTIRSDLILQSPEYSTNCGKIWNKWERKIKLEDIPSTKEETVLIRGIIPANNPPLLKATIWVLSKSPDPNMKNNSCTIYKKLCY